MRGGETRDLSPLPIFMCMPEMIDQQREEIDAIDRQIVELLSQRARCAHHIGQRKRVLELSVLDANREQRIIDALTALNRGPLSNRAIEAIFRTIISETRAYEEEASSEGSIG